MVTPTIANLANEVELGGVSVTSKPKLVSVFNPKTKKQNLTVTFLGAGNTGDFAIVSGPPTTCAVTLAPKARCVIGVTFTSTAPGKRVGVMMVTDNADLNEAQTVKLLGHGIQGKLGYTPASLSFVKQAVHTTSNPKTVKITNPNPVPMAFAASITGDYAIASNTCPSALAAKETCDIGVTFTPTATGSQTWDADLHGYCGEESADREA